MTELAATPKPKKKARRKRAAGIPEGFVYEFLGGQPIYYRGYREAIAQNHPPEHVMGSGRKQAYLIDLLLGYLKSVLDRKTFATAVSEPGVKFGKKEFVAIDIIIYHAADKSRMFTDEYFDFPPHVVLEVDTKADLKDLDWGMDYYHRKTERLLEFGVSKVIWVFTGMRKIMVAQPDQPWLIVNWDDSVDVLPGCTLQLRKLIEEDGVDVDVFFPKEI
jgi:hypothetical protein